MEGGALQLAARRGGHLGRKHTQDIPQLSPALWHQLTSQIRSSAKIWAFKETPISMVREGTSRKIREKAQILKIWRGMAVCELQADERGFVGKRKTPSKAVKRQHQLGLKPPQRERGIWKK